MTSDTSNFELPIRFPLTPSKWLLAVVYFSHLGALALYLFFQYPSTFIAGNVLNRIAQSCLLALQNDLSGKKKSHGAVTE